MIRVLIVKSEKILIAILVLMDNENINQAIKLYPNDQIVEERFIFAFVKYLRGCLHSFPPSLASPVSPTTGTSGER